MADPFHFGNEPLKVGADSVSNRDLFLIECDHPRNVAKNLRFPSRYFVCLLVLNATDYSDVELRDLAKDLLLAGCAYVCCWGPECERMHDLFDHVDLDLRPDGPWTMSTWHTCDPLQEALWFSLFVTWPDDAFVDECRSTVAVVIGSPRWTTEVREAFANPHEFSNRVLASKPELHDVDSGNE